MVDCKAPGTEWNKLCGKELYELLLNKRLVDNDWFCVAWWKYDWVWFDCCETVKLVCVGANAAGDAKIWRKKN